MLKHPKFTFAWILISLSSASPAFAVSPLPPGLTWLWDLEGGHTSGNADVINYDPGLGDASKRGQEVFRGKAKYVICYFSAGTWENGRPDMEDLRAGVDYGAVLKGGNKNGRWEANGEPERILKITDKVKAVMRGRLNDAVARKCDAVEPDNVDVIANRVEYMKWLVQEAHAPGRKLEVILRIGLKNADDDAEEMSKLFDFVIVEQCYQHEECHKYKPFIQKGKAVFIAEYGDYDQDLCADAKKNNFSLTFFPADQEVKNGRPCK